MKCCQKTFVKLDFSRVKQVPSQLAFNQSLIYNLRGLLGDPRPTKRLVREPQLPARLKTIKKMCVLKTI
jgi:hypothetical protein